MAAKRKGERRRDPGEGVAHGTGKRSMTAAGAGARARTPHGRAGRVRPFSPGPPPDDSGAAGPPDFQWTLSVLIVQQWTETLTGDQLQHPANELLAIEHVTGAVVYDVGCRLLAHGLGLRSNTDTRRCALPTEGDVEMLRLRVVEGLALRDIAAICGVSPERVRQRLNLRFGLSGDPPAVLERRRTRVLRRPDWERIIAQRISRAENGLSMAVLLRGFADGLLGGEARAAVARMEAKGFLKTESNRIKPTPALRQMARTRPFRTGRSAGSERTGR